MASEIRVDKINSLSGVGTVTLSPTGVDIAGITTAATLRATTGIVTSLTAGSLTSLGAISGTTGTFTGAVDASNGITLDDAITHRNDTNTKIRFPTDDTVSFETAGSERVRITSDGKIGVNQSTPTGDFEVVGSTGTATTIFINSSTHNTNTANEAVLKFGYGHSGDPDGVGHIKMIENGNNAFDAHFTFSLPSNNGSGGSVTNEKMRIDSSGRVGINTATPSNANAGFDDLVVRGATAGNAGITVLSGTTSAQGTVAFADGTNGTEPYAGYVQYSHSTNKLILGAGAADQVQIEDGNVTLNDCDLVMSSGRGMSFAATSDASGSSSELFDDYEEGTWTPSIRNDGNTPNWTGVNGRYVKIGQQVTVWFNVDGGTTPRSGSSGSSLIMTGMPYSISMFGNPILGIVGVNQHSGDIGVILNVFGQGGTQVRFGVGGKAYTEAINYSSGCFTYPAA